MAMRSGFTWGGCALARETAIMEATSANDNWRIMTMLASYRADEYLGDGQ